MNIQQNLDQANQHILRAMELIAQLRPINEFRFTKTARYTPKYN